ncbi:MAG: hypothetical protein Q7R47_01920 [Candidatus Diapherotrites archaeon]|nr:hypothetical protein [Candidatus Diapherotrites archaeon]
MTNGFVFTADAIFLLLLTLAMLLAVGQTPADESDSKTQLLTTQVHDLQIVWIAQNRFEIDELNADVSMVFPYNDTDLELDGERATHSANNPESDHTRVLTYDIVFAGTDEQIHHLMIRIYDE